MICQVFLSEKAQRDLDTFSDKITNQILSDCAHLADDPIPDGKRIKKLHGFNKVLYRLRAGDYRVIFKRSGTRIDIGASSASRTSKRRTDQYDGQDQSTITSHDKQEQTEEHHTYYQADLGPEKQGKTHL